MVWFSLGSAVNVMVANALGKKIELIICTGSVVKKVTVTASSNDADTTSIKHCGNAPFATCIFIPGAPVDMHFAVPQTIASWVWIASHDRVLEAVSVNMPPPGRAPPAPALA